LAQRRILEDDYVARLKAADESIDTASATETLKSMYDGDWEDNKAVLTFLSESAADIEAKITEVKKAALSAKIEAMQAEVDSL